MAVAVRLKAVIWVHEQEVGTVEGMLNASEPFLSGLPSLRDQPLAKMTRGRMPPASKARTFRRTADLRWKDHGR
jgi:hypothetical protein